MKDARAKKVLKLTEDLLKRASELEALGQECLEMAARLEQSCVEISLFTEAALLEVLPPTCTKCGALCILRQNKSTRGHFWGCSTWPGCKGGTDYLIWRFKAAKSLIAQEVEE